MLRFAHTQYVSSHGLRPCSVR